MKVMTKLVYCCAISAGVTWTSFGAGTWEDRPTGVRDKEGASEWWMSTWKTGDRVETTAQYGITGTMRIFTKLGG